MSNISIGNLAEAILQELENYSESVTEGVKKAVDTVANECNEEIKKHVTFNEPTGKYVKAFKVKKTYESKLNKGKTWHVSGGEYRLTHLLEKGHAKIGGGRTQAFPHIIFGEELAKRRLEELVKEAVENG
ncbi:MAG: HK97 gp10 family phage protein [Bacillus sp. (in: Bacteria)]|nr:HK97 gp10 family phage protein [Bacillus sp. (in: firmicutes)]